MSPNIPVETSLFVKCHVDDDDVHVTLTLFSDQRRDNLHVKPTFGPSMRFKYFYA